MTAAPYNPEKLRLQETRERNMPWKKWGPYLSERQWGTAREDYSRTGNAWDYFSHDQARSRAYRWGEDGLAGIADDRQQLCFAIALWNGVDPILKARLFGLTNMEITALVLVRVIRLGGPDSWHVPSRLQRLTQPRTRWRKATSWCLSKMSRRSSIIESPDCGP